MRFFCRHLSNVVQWKPAVEHRSQYIPHIFHLIRLIVNLGSASLGHCSRQSRSRVPSLCRGASTFIKIHWLPLPSSTKWSTIRLSSNILWICLLLCNYSLYLESTSRFVSICFSWSSQSETGHLQDIESAVLVHQGALSSSPEFSATLPCLEMTCLSSYSEISWNMLKLYSAFPDISGLIWPNLTWMTCLQCRHLDIWYICSIGDLKSRHCCVFFAHQDRCDPLPCVQSFFTSCWRNRIDSTSLHIFSGSFQIRFR